MELITILNRCHRFRGFVYQHAHFSADKKSIEVAVRPRKGSTAVCSRCHLPAPGYDQLAERRFELGGGIGTSMIRICQGKKHFSLHLTGEFSEALVWA
jgi:hypothetical protein